MENGIVVLKSAREDAILKAKEYWPGHQETWILTLALRSWAVIFLCAFDFLTYNMSSLD